MQIVIDISEEEYNYAKQQVADGITNPLKICIANGTVLEPHGRLIDADALVKRYGDSVAFLNGRVGGDYIIAPTILEATKQKK